MRTVLFLTGLLLCTFSAHAVTVDEIANHVGVEPTPQLKKELGPLAKQYRRHKSHKSLAIAFGEGGVYTVGMGAAAPTAIGAAVTALQQCENTKTQYGIDAPCEIFLLGDDFVQLGSKLREGIGGSDPSMVWRITDSQGRQLYLGGTVHVLKRSLYPLPPSFDAAYQASDRIALETNVLLATDPERVKHLQSIFQTEPKANKASMSRSLRKKLGRFVKSHQGNIDVVYRTRSFANSLQVTFVRFAALGYQAEHGIDLHFARRALKDGKPISELENYVDALMPMLEADLEIQHAMLETALEPPATQLEMMESMMRRFAEADTEGLTNLLNQEMEGEGQEAMRQALMGDRNKTMYASMVELMSQPEVTFAMVGAGHIGGSDGLLALFRGSGFGVEQLNNRGEVFVDEDGSG